MMPNTPGNVSSHLYASSRSNTTFSRNTAVPYPHLRHQHHPLFHHHQPIMIPIPTRLSPPPFSGGAGGQDDDEFPMRDERYPQWSNKETRDFIEIRAQLEWEFAASKRNKNLWEMVANRMGEKGYRRTIEQCKGKWKNLVNRYKGIDTADLDHGKLCPFFDELHALFSARANRMQQFQLESDIGSMKGKKKLQTIAEEQSHEEFLEEPDDEVETDLYQTGNSTTFQTKKVDRGKRQKTGKSEKDLREPIATVNDNNGVLATLQETMTNFMQQQLRIDMQWQEMMDKRAQEREFFEREWRQTMEKLERERLVMEQAWREKEEQRRSREESRAEKRDALLTALVNKLIRDESC